MAEQFTLSFPGAGDSTARRCKMHNGTNFPIRNVGISARTAKFPVIWDYFEGMETTGSAHLIQTKGLDSEIVFFKFANFNAGETVTFNAIDPDFTGDTDSAVLVNALVGTRVYVLFENVWVDGFGELQMTDGKLQTAITAG